jgi:hypothetical protein
MQRSNAEKTSLSSSRTFVSITMTSCKGPRGKGERDPGSDWKNQEGEITDANRQHTKCQRRPLVQSFSRTWKRAAAGGPSIIGVSASSLPITDDREVNLYRLGNFVNVQRGMRRIAMARMMHLPIPIHANLYAKVIRGDGRHWISV